LKIYLTSVSYEEKIKYLRVSQGDIIVEYTTWYFIILAIESCSKSLNFAVLWRSCDLCQVLPKWMKVLWRSIAKTEFWPLKQNWLFAISYQKKLSSCAAFSISLILLCMYRCVCVCVCVYIYIYIYNKTKLIMQTFISTEQVNFFFETDRCLYIHTYVCMYVCI
jgi:hypothetical protein